MAKQKQSKPHFLRRISWKLWLLLALLSLLVAATYTWFNLSTKPFVTDMDFYVGSGSGLELALSPTAAEEDWTQSLDLSALLAESNSLRPVTYVDGVLYAAAYGLDGRIAGIDSPLSDEVNSQNGTDPYYISLSFYARSGSVGTVSLSPAVELADGVSGSGTYVYGTPLWDSSSLSHSNGASGAECCIRIGISITLLQAESLQPTGEHYFYLYEPNCDSHLTDSTEYLQTLSITGGSLIDESCLIRQTVSVWTEADPIQRDSISPSLGSFLDDTSLFDINPETIAEITLTIWLEGQDEDCTNSIGQTNYLTASIQFTTDAATSYTGLDRVE